jgi:hypothetical protein
MGIGDFLTRIAEHPDLELLYQDPTVCIILCKGAAGERRIRLGLWAVRRMRWEEIAAALQIAERLPV